MMKMVLVFCAGSKLDAVRRLLDAHEVHGYTELPEVLGAGIAGKHLGTRAWPGTSSMVLTAVAASKVDDLLSALEALARTCSAEEGLRALVLPVERMI